METDVLIALLLITGMAAVIPILAKRLDRFGVPIVVFEIIAGMIVGASGFNLIEPSPILTFLAEFGFAFLMFLSGLELDLRLLNPNRAGTAGERRWTQALPLGLLIFLVTIVLAFTATALFAPAGATSNPLLLGLILSTTSLGVVVPVLKERDLTGGRFGQYIIVASSIADFATLLLLTTVITVLSSGLTLDLLLIPTLLLIFILVARLSLRASRGGRLQQALNSLSSATSQIRVRGAIALMVAWVVLAEAFGVELILGAFLAGAIAGLISGNEDHGEREKLDAIGYGFFIPIFFIMVGVRFNLQAAVNSTEGLLLLLWLVIVAFAVKIVPALLLRLRFTWRQTLGGGMLLSARLSLIIAASAIAFDMGLISETVNSDIIMLAIITVTIAPFLFSRIYPFEEKQRRSGIIVVGQDQLAEYIIERLQNSGEMVTAICPDQSRIEPFRELGVVIIDGCESYDQALEAAGATRARVLLDLTANSEETLELCQIGKKKYGIPNIVSRISDIELIPKLQEMGIKVVQPELATAMALEGAIRYPTAFDVLVHNTEGIDVTEIRVTNLHCNGTRLAELGFPGDVIVLSLQRDGAVIIPHGDTVLQMQDRLGLIGRPASIEEAAALLKR
jgi:Kef-type K+ transport system membrane component KefB/Trk K+ transport system NAD-binding subunit